MSYIPYFILFCMCVLMYRIAEFEKRRGWLWGLITLVIIVVLGQAIRSAYLSAFIGMAIAFCTMIAMNIVKPVKKGPF